MSKIYYISPLKLLFFLSAFFIHLIEPIPAEATSERPSHSPPVEIREGWQYRWGDSPVDGTGAPLWVKELSAGHWDNITLPGQPPGRNGSEYLWLRVQLPEGWWNNPCLYITKVYQTFEVYRDSELIYRYGAISGGDPGKYGGFFPWHVIPLHGDSQGAVISIRIHSYDKYKIGITRNVTYGSQSDIYAKMLKEGIGKITVGGTVIFLGLFALFLYLYSNRGPVYLVFGLASISGGIFLICLSRVNQIMIESPLFWSYTMVLFLFPRPALEFLIIEKLFGAGRKNILTRLWQVNLALAAALLGWSIADPANLIQALRWFELVHAASTFIVIFIIAGFLSKSTDGRIFTAGYIPMILAGFHDILLDLGKIAPLGYMSHWGELIHLSAIALILIRRINEVDAKNKIYSLELEKKSLELEEKNRELFRLDKLKDEFIANTSHQLRTPLSGIIGLADSMIEGAAGHMSKMQVINLSMIVSSCKRLYNLINDILDYSRLKNGDISLNKQPADLGKITELVLTLARPQAAAKNIVLKNNIPGDIRTVFADESRLEQIMHNLVGNALKFTDNGTVAVSAEQKGDMLEITVSDTGAGIPGERIDSIFHPFHQAHSTAAGEDQGTGVGLSITKHLVELHGGSIWAVSSPGEGSKFIFTLPVSTKPKKNEAAVPPVYDPPDEHLENLSRPFLSEIGPGGKYSILVADDEQINLQVLTNYLSLLDFSVTGAINGEDALNLINSREFDLVILDIMMPRLSGFEVLCAIREKYSLFELPVLMLTTKNRPNDIIAGFEAGANDYLAKPFDKKELLARVSTLLVLKQSVTQAVSSAQRLESEWQRRLLAEALNDLTKRLTSTLELPEVLNRLQENMSKIVGCHSSLVILNEEGSLRSVSCSGTYSYKALTDPYSVSENLKMIADALRGGMPIIINDVHAGARFKFLGIIEEVRSWMGVPIIYKGELTGVIVLHHRDPGIYTDRDAGAALSFAGQAGIALENARMFADVKSLAITDELTGLYNRRYFFEFAEHEFHRSRRYNAPLSLIMLDIDNFKKINDTYGHSAGDEILKKVAQRCQVTLRDSDILGRYGGEEFVALLPEANLDMAMAAAERLRKSVGDDPVVIGKNRQVPVSISLGVTTLDRDTPNVASMFDLVDRSLYNAKKTGKNCIASINQV